MFHAAEVRRVPPARIPRVIPVAGRAADLPSSTVHAHDAIAEADGGGAQLDALSGQRHLGTADAPAIGADGQTIGQPHSRSPPPPVVVRAWSAVWPCSRR